MSAEAGVSAENNPVALPAPEGKPVRNKRRTHYEILGVKQTADQEEIKRAFRSRALRVHPDRNPGDPRAAAKFNRVNEAYEVLSDPDRRRAYDIALALSEEIGPRPAGPPSPTPPPRPPPAATPRQHTDYRQWVEERERRAKREEEAARQRRAGAGRQPAASSGGIGCGGIWALLFLASLLVRAIAYCVERF